MDEEKIESTVTSISYKLDAFRQTFETNMDIVMNKLKEEVLGELKDFKERILETMQARDKVYDKKLKALEDKLDGFKESVTFQEQEIEDLKSENAKMLQRCQIYEGQIAKNEKEIQFIKEDTLQIQAKSMSANLVFHNIPEQGNENSQMTSDILMTFIRDELKVQSQDINVIVFDRVHRIRKKLSGKSRPIVARFNPFRGKEIVLRHAKNLDKAKNYSISEQLPSELQDRKQRLMPVSRSQTKTPKNKMDGRKADSRRESCYSTQR